MAYNWLGHDIYLATLVIDRASTIRAHSGYGTIVIDFRHGTMVSCKSTVRDHLPKEIREDGQDSHQEVGEGQKGD
jgi:hypothetical protein